jgi:hypothetical protein
VPLTKKGEKILRHMKDEYKNSGKAESVFYASINAGKVKGAEKKSAGKKGSR